MSISSSAMTRPSSGGAADQAMSREAFHWSRLAFSYSRRRSASETLYSRGNVVVKDEGIASGFIEGRIAEWYLGRHGSAAGRDRSPHVDRRRPAPGARTRTRGGLRRRPDLPEEPASVGGAAAPRRGDPRVRDGATADRHPARLRSLELPHQSGQSRRHGVG